MSTEKFSITDSAAKKVLSLLADEKPHSKFRIEVMGGGCSGFKYNYRCDDQSNKDDKLFEKNGALVVIDEISLDSFLQGSTLDYIEKLGGSYFEIRNPNSSARCGCGNSFSV